MKEVSEGARGELHAFFVQFAELDHWGEEGLELLLDLTLAFEDSMEEDSVVYGRWFCTLSRSR